MTRKKGTLPLKSALIVVLLVALSIGIFSVNASAATAGRTVADGTYYIQSSLGNYVIDCEGASLENGTPAILYQKGSGSNQWVDIKYIDNGYYKLTFHHSGKAFDIQNDAGAGAKIIQYPWTGGSNERWKIESCGNGEYRFVSGSGKNLVMDVSGGVGKNGTAIVAWTWNGGANQRFKLIAVDKNEVARNDFVNDSRWKNGVSWSSGKTPVYSKAVGKGCFAYAADFAKYVYEKDSPRSGSHFTNAGEIKAGDILHLTPEHFMCVLARSGNSLKIAHGNWGGKVVVDWYTMTQTNGTWKIAGKTFSDGWHF